MKRPTKVRQPGWRNNYGTRNNSGVSLVGHQIALVSIVQLINCLALHKDQIATALVLEGPTVGALLADSSVTA